MCMVGSVTVDAAMGEAIMVNSKQMSLLRRGLPQVHIFILYTLDAQRDMTGM